MIDPSKPLIDYFQLTGKPAQVKAGAAVQSSTFKVPSDVRLETLEP